MTVQSAIAEKAEAVIVAYRARGLSIATAESCTGGLVCGALTDIAGSSSVLDRGFVTYSNGAKQQMLGVHRATLDTHGAVSRPVAIEMAEGARKAACVAVAVAVTGIAGPGGGTPDKPIGLVHFAWARSDRTMAIEKRFGDLGRGDIRVASVSVALDMLLAALD